MKKTRFIRIVALILACLTFTGAGSIGISAASGSSSSSSTGTVDLDQLREILNAMSYEDYSEKYANVPKATNSKTYDASVYNAAETTSEVEVLTNYEGSTGKSLLMTDTGKVSWDIEVPATGMYTISIEYYPVVSYTMQSGTAVTGRSASIEKVFYINGKVPFSEARYLSMTKKWENIYKTDENGNTAFQKDTIGNDVRPTAQQTPEWMTYTFTDSSGYYPDPLEFYLEKGTTTISLEAEREPVIIKSITIAPGVDLPEYSEISAGYTASGYTSVSDAATVYIDAEKPTSMSDETIYPYTDRTSSKTEPQSAAAQLLNTIGGSENYKTAGQWVSYEFTVEKSGLYEIAARYRQSELSGMFTSRVIKINGEVLFQEAYNTRFDYSKEWRLEALGDGDQTFQFYFEAGKTYTVELEVGLGEIADVIRQVELSLNNINASYLEIMKLTGASPDKYRDYGFYRLMPETINQLIIEYRNLTAVSDFLTELCGTKGSHVATLDKVTNLLKRMASSEDQIAKNLTNLKTYIGTLGTWLNDTRTQPLQLDYLLIMPAGTELPGNAQGNFFQSAWFEIQLFFNSFFIDYSEMGKTGSSSNENTVDMEPVEVWISEGRDQALIIRNLIDSQFTPNSGIPVNLKLVAAGTLLPSVLSGTGPDCFIGIGGTDVSNYAIRNAVIPLNDFEGFDEICSEFTDAALYPVTLYGKTYGLPEKMTFSMMFIRKDILADLGIEVPQTWDDVLSALPILQANNMQVGLVHDNDIFLYQMGGDRWADDGMRTGLDSNIGLEAFEYYVNFYTMYSFPVKYDAANRFRTGEMPIIIDNYTAIYNQLTVFATEIRGLWEFVPLPGVMQEDGTIKNCSIAAVVAVAMLTGCNDQQATWEFMKWFCGKDAQAKYSNGLATTIGPAAKHPTANREALAEMPWTSDEKINVLAQFENIAAIYNYPGCYIFARYINFAYLAAVNDDKDPIEELRSYITTINKEITRKRKEFGLDTLELGETLESRAAAQAAESGSGGN